MIHRSAAELREEMRRRELFFAHIAAQAAEARRATVRRQAIMAGVTILTLIGLAVFVR